MADRRRNGLRSKTVSLRRADEVNCNRMQRVSKGIPLVCTTVMKQMPRNPNWFPEVDLGQDDATIRLGKFLSSR